MPIHRREYHNLVIFPQISKYLIPKWLMRLMFGNGQKQSSNELGENGDKSALKSTQQMIVPASVYPAPQLRDIRIPQLSDDEQMREYLTLAEHVLNQLHVLTNLRLSFQEDLLQLVNDPLLLMESSTFPQSLHLPENLPAGRFGIAFLLQNPRNLLFLKVLDISLRGDLDDLFEDAVLLHESDRYLFLAFIQILSFCVIQRANFMKPVHNHEVALALEKEGLELGKVQDRLLAVVFLSDLVQEALPGLDREEDKLVLPLPAAVLLEDCLVFPVELIELSRLQLRIYVLGPFVAQVRCFFTNGLNLFHKIFERFFVLRVHLGLVEPIELRFIHPPSLGLPHFDGNSVSHFQAHRQQ